MNFALIMFVLLLITGGVWLLDLISLRRTRAMATQQALKLRADELVRKPNEAEDAYLNRTKTIHDEIQRTFGAEPWWVEYAKSFFPVILAVFLIRSFLAEPFKIPSGSMIPTLQVGDFILVNKFTYGLRLPIVNQKVVQLNDPERGDVMVFRYPENPSLDYIKRVIGLPGDVIEYRDKRLWVNGVEQIQQSDGEYTYVEQGLNLVRAEKRQESLGENPHALLVTPGAPTVRLDAVAEFGGRENCIYDHDMVRCKVPDGHYFMLGDNRDNSRDSRYWGFVPDNQIVGKAFLVWMNFSDWKRIGHAIK